MTNLLSWDRQQNYLVDVNICCLIFESEVWLCQKHCSLTLKWAMVCEGRWKQGPSVISFHTLLLGTTTELSVPIMQISLICNLSCTDFQWDWIHQQTELLVFHYTAGLRVRLIFAPNFGKQRVNAKDVQVVIQKSSQCSATNQPLIFQ